ncbi:MAG: fasciclin domain-containing protein [Actinomycetota bacterium]|nr:fasciclin domain-containing protein [Actinomycetota bacterium]MDH5224055.1 fasciclin domain-containing protein [Actinomycetota bacterium]
MRRNRKFLTMLAVIASLSLVGAACSSDDSTSSSTTSPESPASAEASETITDIVAADADFSTLLAAVQASDLGDTLAGEGPFTVFAPTDEAFAALPEGILDTLLLPENKDQLAAVLTYHVVPAEVMAADVESGEVTTVNGATFSIDVSDAGVVITDGEGNQAQVVTTDIVASNGVIHVIDAVLLPPAS